MSDNGHLHVDDVGTELRCTFKNPDETAFDVSTALTKQISFERPDGTSFSRDADFSTDGTDGVLLYVTAEDDLDQAGNWWLQGHIVLPSAELHSDRVKVRIYENNR